MDFLTFHVEGEIRAWCHNANIIYDYTHYREGEYQKLSQRRLSGLKQQELCEDNKLLRHYQMSYYDLDFLYPFPSSICVNVIQASASTGRPQSAHSVMPDGSR